MKRIAFACALLAASAVPAAAQSLTDIDGWSIDGDYAVTNPGATGGTAPAPATPPAMGTALPPSSWPSYPYTPPATECPAFTLCW